jgi:hypothetical protein
MDSHWLKSFSLSTSRNVQLYCCKLLNGTPSSPFLPRWHWHRANSSHLHARPGSFIRHRVTKGLRPFAQSFISLISSCSSARSLPFSSQHSTFNTHLIVENLCFVGNPIFQCFNYPQLYTNFTEYVNYVKAVFLTARRPSGACAV